MKKIIAMVLSAGSFGLVWVGGAWAAEDFPKPYSPPCVERENVFEFTEKPRVKNLGNDKYEITFAVKGSCDVTVGIVDPQGVVVRHIGSGVLGANAPVPFQKNSLKQTLYWNGKDDLDVYHKEPEKLKVRVMLGLKPVFDKRLGGASPYNLPCGAWGVAIDAAGAYVFAFNGGGFNHGCVRKFGHNGEYLGTIFPPPTSFPMEKSAGMSFIEYEPGKRTLHGADLGDAIAGNGGVLRGATGSQSAACQIALAGNRLVHLGVVPNTVMYYLYTDGSSDMKGLAGMPMGRNEERGTAMLAASPDGQWVYITSLSLIAPHAVVRKPADGSKPHEAFIGTPGKPGSDNAGLNNPSGLDCDAQGRIYVADSSNNRIQIFGSDGKHLKTIPVDRPRLVRVHQKTGAMYVQHGARVEGRSVARLTKYTSFDNPAAEFFVDGIGSGVMAVDSWSARPRLWLCSEMSEYHGRAQYSFGLRIVEEDGKEFRSVLDFEQEAKKEAGENYMGRWGGDCFDKTTCDPVREQAYYGNSRVFDLRSGKLLGSFSTGIAFDDMAFDKCGYLHLHFNPCFFGQGVGRVHPDRASEAERAKGVFRYPECPYDYGEEARGWLGILPTKDQCGAKGFQDGLGVNMRGEVASECNIYYVPKWEDEVRGQALAGNEARLKSGVWSEEENSYNAWVRSMDDARKRGEEVYYIKHKPGIPLSGGTVWTYDRHGELRRECAVIGGDLINGVQIDEDRSIYFVNARPKMHGEKPFLYGKGGILGTDKRQAPFTGTLIKSKPDQQCQVIMAQSKVPMEPLPSRPPDLMALDFMEEAYMGKGSWCWVEGAEWIYAGAGPLTSVGCSCPRQHLGLDWYKRTYVPEGYRHSIGVLDTAGNLIMHLGQYGNFDDAPGGKDGAKPGGENIGIMSVRFISATDNYLVFGDWAERLVVLKLNYHAEESAGILLRPDGYGGQVGGK